MENKLNIMFFKFSGVSYHRCISGKILFIRMFYNKLTIQTV